MPVKPMQTNAFRAALTTAGVECLITGFMEEATWRKVPAKVIDRDIVHQLAGYLASTPELLKRDSRYQGALDEHLIHRFQLVAFHPDKFDKFLEAYRESVLEEIRGL